ncbi:M48 family metalloprotease [Actinoplanes sp. G11-F43]|uniref:M48 family metalloprotease n=1 Tax=Actinoplanes sp. G11-F43 TaxID=3424130 RepID=UPI003D3306C0
MSKGAPAAARSAAALAGFVIVAGLQLAVVLIALGLLLRALPGGFALRIGVPLSIATIGALGYATWRALHTRHRVPAGVAVSRDQAPRLWEMVDAAAAAARVPAPSGVTVVADATAALGERTRLLGLIGGRRDLYLGLPLLQALEPDRLAAIVAHELGHGSPTLGRWAPMAYRGRVAVGRTIPRIARRNVAGAVLRAYAGVYRRLDAPFSRAQELNADRIAAAHAGTAAAVAALRDLPALAGMQRLFHAEYVGPGWQAGYVPDDVFGGLLRVLAARTTEMAMLRARDPEPSGPWDTHPPLPERIAALTATDSVVTGAEPSGSAMSGSAASGRESAAGPADSARAVGDSSDSSKSSPVDNAVDEALAKVGAGEVAVGGATSPAGSARRADTGGEPGRESVPDQAPVPNRELVPDLPGLGRTLQAVAFPPRGRTVVSWDDCLSVARTSEMEREAEAALAAIARAVGAGVPDAAHLLTLAADGRLRAAATTLFPDAPPEEATSRIVELLALMLALAALRSGVARWRHSWTGAAEVVAVDGGYLDLAELAAAAADPETTEAVRAYLTQAGVDLSASAAESGSARAQVLGGLVNLSADGSHTDVLITDLGLLLVPGLPRNRRHESKRRLTRIAADGIPAGALLPAGSGSAGSGPGGSGSAGPGPGPAGPRSGAGAGPGADQPASAPAATGRSSAGGAAGSSVGDAASGRPDASAGGLPGASAGGSPGASAGGLPDAPASGSASGSAGASRHASTGGTTGGSAGSGGVLPRGGRFVSFADVAGVTTLPGLRKGWAIGLRDGGELTLRPALDADELPGGWAAWDEAVAFLAGTR